MPDKKYHKTLIRQIRHFYANQDISPDLEKLLDVISETYNQAEKDRLLLGRAMQISSKELAEANRKARAELEQKQLAERILREKDRILNSINENVSEAVYRTTPNLGITFVNKAFIELFGFDSEEEALSTPVNTFYTDPQQRQYLLQEIKEKKVIKGEEILFCRKDGSTFWGIMNVATFIDEKGQTHYDGAIIDITHQKNNEDKLKDANEELKKINRELDSFVYSIGHDLRAPIASTLGLVELCKEEEDIPTLKMYNSLKEKSLLKLDAFIQDVLGYSRNARLELELVPINVFAELESMKEMLVSSSDIKNIDLSIDIQANTDFYSDKYRFNLVFSNLISNAFRYHNAQAESKYIRIKAEINAYQAIFEVSDNGQGIDAAHIDKIFNMFYRANKSAKGSGLGLYIVKEAITKLSGEISVKSTLGKGTTFKVFIPNKIDHQLGVSVEQNFAEHFGEK